jgi:hypothetical protein
MRGPSGTNAPEALNQRQLQPAEAGGVAVVGEMDKGHSFSWMKGVI